MKRFIAASLLSLVSISANAAIEIDEKEGFGPTYGSSVLDLTIGKPLQVVGATFGTALHIVGLPFSIGSQSVEESYENLVSKPWSALKRCTGCSPAYDNYVKSLDYPKNQVRFTVDGPAEIVIQSNGEVLVNP